MTTVKQLERLWVGAAHSQLLQQLMVARPEGVGAVRLRLNGPNASAAMVLVRLDELHQSQSPLYTRLVRHLLTTQHEDGGWDDPMTTALCLRALMLGQGNGLAVDRGLDYLANLQKDDGAWPAEPLRRMPADSMVTVFILNQLAGDSRFRDRVAFERAVHWATASEGTMDPDAARLWTRTSARCKQPVSERTLFPHVAAA